MARGIKFRAWLDGRKMIVTSYDFVNGIATGLGWDIQEGEDEVSWFTRDIEQFTGLHDKNGKEIYEGDIVRQWDVNSIVTSLEYVAFRVSECTLDEGCEVIGNIHEEARE